MSAELQGFERQLADLGALLETPREPDLAAVVRRRLETVPARRRLPLPVVWTRRSLAIAIAMVLLAASAAVATYFGVRGVRVRVGETPPPAATATAGVGSSLDLGERIALAAAEDEVSFPILVPGELGAPDETYISRAYPGYRVTLLYRPRPGLPEAAATKTGLLLFEFVGSIERGGLDKYAAPAQVREISVGDVRGLWIEGPHTIAWLGPSGELVADTVRIAGNVLLWERGQVTLRLESSLSMAEAIRIAESVR